jgi:hypothetical protein
MDNKEIIYLAVMPSQAPSTDLVKQVALIVNEDPLETQISLSGKIPSLIAVYRHLKVAESAADALRKLGLKAKVCSEAFLSRKSDTFQVHSCKFQGQEIIFWDGNGKPMEVDSSNTFLLVEGSVDVHEERKILKTKMKFDLPATLLTGGIPIRRKVVEQSKEMSVQVERFLRFYGMESADPKIEIKQHDFDYSGLGLKIAASSLVNFNALVSIIRDSLPGVLFDESLKGHYLSDAGSQNPLETIDIVCRLVYLFHKV